MNLPRELPLSLLGGKPPSDKKVKFDPRMSLHTKFVAHLRKQDTCIIGTILLTKFHEDRKINVASRPYNENAPPPGSHVFQPTSIIFEIFQEMIGMNLLTKFHEDRQKNAPHLGSHFFQANLIIFELIQDIIGTNLLTKFHDDRQINVTSRVLTRKIAPPLWWPYIIGMNLLTEFHEHRTINVASRVLTRFYYSLIRKNAPPLGGHVIQANVTILELIQDISQTNLTIFHQDRTINVASRVLTRKNAPPPGSHVFQPTGLIFELVQDIIGMNLLTKFHKDWTINVTSRVLTRKIAPPLWWPYIIGMNLLAEFHEDRTINVASKVKNALPLGGHVIPANVTIFELIQDIIKTNLLTIIHQDRTINVASRVKNAPAPYISGINLLTKKNAPPPGSHVFQRTGIIFELVQDIIGLNLLTKFHEDQTINVASRVKNAPPLGSHVFQANVTIFELIQDIIKTNLLTKFHEDWTINVASRE
ncbi:hypothetical protein DPMN_005115 [Dreissena polymorpha]|uniref:Uncharacterized protein n=1 Tax=Dreissena polymorpha TaxID=45954 RepID=A0A9D4RWI4_DREPO|nr:hypothetical protein DPMN_005115 [Dreissena polymorpha]